MTTSNLTRNALKKYSWEKPIISKEVPLNIPEIISNQLWNKLLKRYGLKEKEGFYGIWHTVELRHIPQK